MKKYIYTVALALAAVVSSCSKSDDFATRESSQQVTFTLAAAQPQTRATETVTLSRYVMEVYEDAACNTPALVFENGTANHKEQSSPAFTLILDKTKSYTCLFWADDDASAAVYNVASLKSVALITDAEPVEGFFATQTVNSEAASYDIAMNRAVAKVVLMEKDKIKAASILVTSFNHCTTFNVKDGSATDSESKTITTTITDAINGTSEAPATVASFYTLAPAEGTTVDFSFTLNNEGTKTVSNAPLKANFVTSLKGEFSGLTSKTFIATATDDWAGELEIAFADPAFKAVLVGNYNIPTNLAGDIDYTNAETLTALRAITELDVEQKGIYSLKGIEYMTNLQKLLCQYNNLTHLDVSGLTNLKYLSCDNNNISSLDVSTLTQLRCIYCYVNKLTSLDITKNANLAEVCCGAQRDNATLNLTLLSSQQSMWENIAFYSTNINVTPIYQD